MLGTNVDHGNFGPSDGSYRPYRAVNRAQNDYSNPDHDYYYSQYGTLPSDRGSVHFRFLFLREIFSQKKISNKLFHVIRQSGTYNLSSRYLIM